jgi:fused signal recognition particle receptor
MTSGNEHTVKQGWFSKLKAGLSKTSSGISGGITQIFTRRKLDDVMLEELEEVLILSDVGAHVAAQLVAKIGKNRFGKEVSAEEIKVALADEIEALLAPVAVEMEILTKAAPHVILVVGVNGNGKTTTMGKMAARLKSEGFSVMMAAADTFRAAATQQLEIWGQRAGVPVITAPEGTDAASVAFRALEEAKAQKVDVLLIDTAGRLHNKNNLMQELQKIARVLKKLDEDAPHTVLQVLDGTTGQNALAQVEAFKTLVDVNGLVVTKLDGTAKGGVVVALADKFKLPIYAVGVGESADDLREFSARDFARSLVGLEAENDI